MNCRYKKGNQIATLSELAAWLSDGNSVYIRDRFNHFGWVMSFQLRYAMAIVKQGIVFKAVKTEDPHGL